MPSFYEMNQQMGAKRVSYTAVVLSPAEQKRLVEQYRHLIPADWETVGHHMTINMGPAANGPAASLVGEHFAMTIKTFASDNRVMAVGVETDAPSTNATKHITLAVNRKGGGKPFHSNQLIKWESISPFEVHGSVQEV